MYENFKYVYIIGSQDTQKNETEQSNCIIYIYICLYIYIYIYIHTYMKQFHLMGWKKHFALSNVGDEWSLRLKAKEAEHR